MTVLRAYRSISPLLLETLFSKTLKFTNKSLHELVKTLKPDEFCIARQYIENYVPKESKLTPNIGFYDNQVGAGSSRERIHSTSGNVEVSRQLRFIDDEDEVSDNEEMDEGQDDEMTEYDMEFIDDTETEVDICFYRDTEGGNEKQQYFSLSNLPTSYFRSTPYAPPIPHE